MPAPVRRRRRMVPRPAALQPTGAPAEDDVAPADERLVVDVDAAQARTPSTPRRGSPRGGGRPAPGRPRPPPPWPRRLAWEGRRVLVVAERSAALADVLDRLEEADLRSIALDVPANADPELLRRQLVQAVLRSERAVDPNTARDEAALAERRRRLQEHVGSLHHVRPLGLLTIPGDAGPGRPDRARDAAGRPPVRLKRSVLDSTVNRQAVGEQLVRAGELGAFRPPPPRAAGSAPACATCRRPRPPRSWPTSWRRPCTPPGVPWTPPPPAP